MIFTEQSIQKVRDAADIVDVVGAVVALKKSGNHFWGLCPFHSEKTPSFSVRPDWQVFKCFGCGKFGDVFSFVMESEGLGFADAVARLASRFGVDLEYKNLSPAQKKARDQRQEIFRINRMAANYFQECLAGPLGEPGRRYLAQRAMPKSIVANFMLGWAPDDWHGLENYLASQGVGSKGMVLAGLVAEKNGRTYDRFRGRIMFPIENVHREIAGFGGRLIQGDGPKYLNTPQSPVYDKSRTLYGLPQAAASCRDAGFAFVVEGYFDVLSLVAAGVENVVAPCGTALTMEHVRVLKGYAKTACLVFDGDKAGRDAARRGVDIMISAALPVRVVRLPNGHDPDTFVREQGAESFRELARRSPDHLAFLLDDAMARHGNSPDGRVEAAKELTRVLVSIREPLERSMGIRRVAERLGLDERAVQLSVRKAWRAQSAVTHWNGGAGRAGEHGADRPEAPLKPGRERQEREILLVCLCRPELAGEILERRLFDYFENPVLRSAARVLVSRLAGTDKPCGREILSYFSDERERMEIAALCFEDRSYDRRQARMIIDHFVETRIQARRARDLTAKIKEAARVGDSELLARLIAEKSKMRELRG